MEDYFLKYKSAKIALSKMIGQFYDYLIPIDKANNLGITYNEDDIDFEYVRCIFHMFKPEGEYAWKVLGLEKPIVTYKELWNKRFSIKDEEKLEGKNYYEEYLRITLVVTYMVEEYYHYDLSLGDAKRMNLDYDEDFDEINGIINTYYHIYESAGEEAWNLLGFEKTIIASSKIYDKQKELKEELLELTQIKKKKLGEIK